MCACQFHEQMLEMWISRLHIYGINRFYFWDFWFQLTILQYTFYCLTLSQTTFRQCFVYLIKKKEQHSVTYHCKLWHQINILYHCQSFIFLIISSLSHTTQYSHQNLFQTIIWEINYNQYGILIVLTDDSQSPIPLTYFHIITLKLYITIVVREKD